MARHHSYKPNSTPKRAIRTLKSSFHDAFSPLSQPVTGGSSFVQPKLQMGAVNDPLEREADRMAETVMRMAAPEPSHSSQPVVQRMTDGSAERVEVEEELVQAKRNDLSVHPPAIGEAKILQRKSNCACGGSCSKCSGNLENQPKPEVSVVQRASGSSGKAKMPSKTESQIQSLSGGGAPLSRAETGFFEPRFGRSFDNVRIHTGDAADQAAKSINARAFTLGNNIAFAKGEYDSSSTAGRTLMAHELTHTIQQSAGTDSVQRGSAGIFGGTCCNPSEEVEWALVGEGEWKMLEQGDCTEEGEDCDGMTCGGGFYHVDNLQTGSCSTPRNDDATFAPRRWTPTSQRSHARSPEQEESANGNTPPDYIYDTAEIESCSNPVKTIAVDFISLFRSSRNPSAELADANRIYRNCCVQFRMGRNETASETDTRNWLGGTQQNDRGTCGSPSPSERNMWDGAARPPYNLSSRFRVFFVESHNFPSSPTGTTFTAYSTFERCPRYRGHVVAFNNARSDVLAHEFGHILLDSSLHEGIENRNDLRNLMQAPVRTASDLDPSQCAIIYGNA